MKPSNWKIAHKGLALAMMPWILSLVFLITLSYLLLRAEQETRREARAREVSGLTANIARCFFESISTISTYMVTRSAAFGLRFEQLKIEDVQLNDRLAVLVKGSAPREHALTQLRQAELKSLELLDILKEAADEGDATTLTHVAAIRGEMEAAVKGFVYRLGEFSKLPGSRQTTGSFEPWNKAFKWFIGGGFILSALACLFSTSLFSRHITKRIEIIVENTRKLARKEPLPPTLSGNDEIATLDSTFHDMALALDESARRERAVVDNAVDVICSLNSEYQFVAVSPAATRVWNREPEGLVGSSVSVVLTDDDLTNFREALTRIKTTRQACTVENQTNPQSGGPRTMLWSADWSDTQDAFFCVVHDITERKEAEEMLRESEERFRTIIEHIPVGLLIVNKEGNIETGNRWIENVLGVSLSGLRGVPAQSLIEERVESQSELNELVNRTIHQPVECEARKADGSLLEVELSSTAFRAGNEERFLLAIADVTARRQVERLKGEFVAMLSHDLRSPLTAIRVALGILNRPVYADLTSEGCTVVSNAQREVDRLLQMINDLLDLERLNDGKMPLHKEPVLIQNVVSEAIESMRLLAEKNGVILASDVEPCEIFADCDRLVRVVINLLSNAIKYSPSEGIVTVHCRAAQEYLEVRVSDQGPGLPVGYESLIFKRFEQLTPMDTVSKSGSGLGLAICKAIVESHGGEIDVKTKSDGTGSTFWFRLPIGEP